MSAIDNITRHYREKLSGGLASIDVPEWSDGKKPFRIFFKSATNPRIQERIAKLSTQQKFVEAAVETLLIRALNEDGSPMFNNANKQELMNECDVDVLIRVVREINEYSAVEADTLEGN